MSSEVRARLSGQDATGCHLSAPEIGRGHVRDGLLPLALKFCAGTTSGTAVYKEMFKQGGMQPQRFLSSGTTPRPC